MEVHVAHIGRWSWSQIVNEKTKVLEKEYNTPENQIQGLISTVAENNKGDFSLREEHSDFKI